MAFITDGEGDKVSSVGRKFITMTPNDGADLPVVAGDWLGGFIALSDGNVRVELLDDTTPHTIPVIKGGIYPFKVRKLYDFGTTAIILGYEG